jgi:hypothetical protein
VTSAAEPYPEPPHFTPIVNLVKAPPAPPVPRIRGARWWLLMFCAYGCIGRGLIFDYDPIGKVDTPKGLLLTFSTSWLHAYSIGWIVAGVLLVYLAFSRRYWRWMFALAATPAFGWCLGYLWAALKYDPQNINGFLVYHFWALVVFWSCMQLPSRGFRR